MSIGATGGGWLGIPSLCASAGLLLVLSLASANAATNESTLRQAEARSNVGDLQGALELLEDQDQAASSPMDGPAVDANLLRADLLRRQGKLSRAARTLSRLQEALGTLQNQRPEITVQVQRQLALLALQSGAPDKADAEIARALALQEHVSPELRASLLNDAALIRQQTDGPAATIEQFLQAADIVAGQPDEATYRINAARAMLEDGRLADFEDSVRRLDKSLADSPSPFTVRHRIALALLYRKAVNEFGADATYRLQAFEQLQEAGRQGAASPRDQSLISGYTAQLYADDRQYDVALGFGRVALTTAAQAGAADLEYRWEWLLGKSHEALGDTEAAMAAYDRAITALDTLRNNLEAFDQGTLNEIVKPLYYGYANLLLKQSLPLQNGTDKQQLLSRTRATLEGLKRAEVQDYFRAQCVAGEEVVLDQMAASTAVLYPVLLEDRLELLLTTATGIQQFSVAIDRPALVNLVRDFRLNLEANTGTNDYLRQAQQLFTLLIKPLEPVLAEARVDTLVFVPDGPLRTIPLAALHDGNGYLIERFALAITPGLTLIDPKAFAGQSYPTLAGGVSESVQGFPALPSVGRELTALGDIMDAKTFTNSAFTLNRVESELKSGAYSVVHFATHGQFGNSYDESFLLTYDDKLKINELGRYIQSRPATSEPLELLVLSACETAAGDDRAALGLAGVALKAGARSALATLWEVDDQSTLDIVTEFYRALSGEGDSKAHSLQRAQLKLIQSDSDRHPSKWAPFLLIGNWL